MANHIETQVYLMQDTTNDFYKIGRSKEPRYREKTLQSEKPTIELLFCFAGSRKDEKYLHEHFKEKRIRGEWFHLDDDDVAYIKEYANKIVKPWDELCAEADEYDYSKYDFTYNDEGEVVFRGDANNHWESHRKGWQFLEWGTPEWKECERQRIKDEHPE